MKEVASFFHEGEEGARFVHACLILLGKKLDGLGELGEVEDLRR